MNSYQLLRSLQEERNRRKVSTSLSQSPNSRGNLENSFQKTGAQSKKNSIPLEILNGKLQSQSKQEQRELRKTESCQRSSNELNFSLNKILSLEKKWKDYKVNGMAQQDNSDSPLENGSSNYNSIDLHSGATSVSNSHSISKSNSNFSCAFNSNQKNDQRRKNENSNSSKKNKYPKVMKLERNSNSNQILSNIIKNIKKKEKKKFKEIGSMPLKKTTTYSNNTISTPNTNSTESSHVNLIYFLKLNEYLGNAKYKIK